MYFAAVEAGFNATHSVRAPGGAFEAPHAHDWGVRAVFARPELDADEMVIDFCQVQEALATVLQSLDGRDLNKAEAFAGRIPTAEVVAAHVFDRLETFGIQWLHRVEVTEAPGCMAAFER